MVTTVVPVLAGVTLVLLSLLDVGMAVLHIQVESPLTTRLSRALWHVLTTTSRLLPRRLRDEVLAWGMPLMVGTTIGFWVVMDVLGFSLIYAPFIQDPAHFRHTLQDAASVPAWLDAGYFSAVTLLTIGYGDIIPIRGALRLMAILEGAVGLLTISLSVTYLLSVYPAVTRKMALANTLNQEAGGRTDGVAIAQRYVAAGRADALGERLRWLNDELLHLGQAHSFYPLLFYTRPREVHESFVRVLAVIQGLLATLRYALDPVTYRDVVSDPRLLILEEGFLNTLHRLERSPHLDDAVTQVDTDGMGRDFQALVAALAARDLSTVSPSDPAALAAYTRFRQGTDGYIASYAANAGYPLGAVRAIYDRWARDTALVVEQPAT